MAAPGRGVGGARGVDAREVGVDRVGPNREAGFIPCCVVLGRGETVFVFTRAVQAVFLVRDDFSHVVQGELD